jgi:hypothetical protein
MFSKSTKTGNVLSEIESQGFRLRRASAPDYLRLLQYPSGNMYQRLNDTSSRNPGLPGERTAERFCCNRQNPNARGRKNWPSIRRSGRRLIHPRFNASHWNRDVIRKGGSAHLKVRVEPPESVRPMFEHAAFRETTFA